MSQAAQFIMRLL